MKILVTGATGFLGQNLVRHLLSAGETVRVLARSATRAMPLVQEGAELVEGQLTSQATIKTALQDVEVVYHLAGRLLEPGVPPAEYYDTHVVGTRSLLECALPLRGLKRFVYTSTTGVLGASGAQPKGESTPAAPTNVYEETKREAEQLVRSAIGRNFPACIVRPGLVYGPGDLHLLGFFRAIQRGLFRPIGSRPVWLHPIYIDDMNCAFVYCGQHPAALGECFHFANREPVTIADLASEIAAALGKPRLRGRIPLPVAQLAAAAGDLLPGSLKSLAPLTRSRLDFLTHSRVYDVTKAERLLGFSARMDLPTGIARTVDWYRRENYL